MQLLLLVAGYLAFVTASEITLSDFQPIALFSDSCTEAYNTPITNCDDVKFAPFGGYSTCSRECWDELNSLVTTIQVGCQHDGVKPDTVIAHAFQGDLANWMCARGTYTTASISVASGTATNAKASTTASATSTVSSTSDSETSTTESSSSESSSSSDESTSSSVASSSSTTLSSFTTTTTTTSQSAAAAPSSTNTQPRPTNSIDSTPFDQTVGQNAAPGDKKKGVELLVVKVVVPTVSALIVLGLGSWMY